MKNYKLSWELSSNLRLQSENEVIRCTAFDVEQKRFFFAASTNFIYTTHLSLHISLEPVEEPESNKIILKSGVQRKAAEI
ncbi:hypothetical protein L2E82_47959 [Cichorium intybus]|uniref:Uncharacterized protein n=1 Tax=Cichorium intybus TaxID=13427 RepID=A0ACB8YXP0_CICIN|nr:hypothetical protein L2E82_47959 [Cichorium intybus]